MSLIGDGWEKGLETTQHPPTPQNRLGRFLPPIAAPTTMLRPDGLRMNPVYRRSPRMTGKYIILAISRRTRFPKKTPFGRGF